LKKSTIYLDNASTTVLDPLVIKEFTSLLEISFGNAASRTHSIGFDAKKIVDYSRFEIASIIGAKQEELIFNSGATEGINNILKGLFEAYGKDKNEIITSPSEHKAILDTCTYLVSKGAIIHYLEIDKNGLINLTQLEKTISSKTLLVSIMLVNNETGVIQDIDAISQICKKNDVLFMTDATQAVGKIDIDVEKSGIDLMTFSAHKIYGPKGVGAMYVRQKYPRINIVPLMHGGGHEKGYRSGTINVPGIGAFAKAIEICKKKQEHDSKQVKKLRNKLETALLKIEGVEINGSKSERSPYISSVYIPGVNSEAIIINVKNTIAISNGSACTSKEMKPSHVIMSMYHNEDRAFSTLRISYSRFNTEKEIEIAIESIKAGIERIREQSLT
jgi:cysteine desulfurase